MAGAVVAGAAMVMVPAVAVGHLLWDQKSCCLEVGFWKFGVCVMCWLQTFRPQNCPVHDTPGLPQFPSLFLLAPNLHVHADGCPETSEMLPKNEFATNFAAHWMCCLVAQVPWPAWPHCVTFFPLHQQWMCGLGIQVRWSSWPYCVTVSPVLQQLPSVLPCQLLPSAWR